MISPAPHGNSRLGLDQRFESGQRRKSDLLLQARLLLEAGDVQSAASRFAEAATVEERLSDACTEKGLADKSWVHRFSAASCWAAAGNFYNALAHCDALLSQQNLPERLRSSASEYAQTIRTRRAEWYATLERQTADAAG